jgi:histidinol-phosphate phosphatase family protein
MNQTFDVVIPTTGRASLRRLINALGESSGRLPREIVIVDDRAGPALQLDFDLPGSLAARIKIVRSGGGGPARARNAGWRACCSPWVAFLDDDVVPSASWLDDLAADLEGLPASIAASQGSISVPRTWSGKPTDWERGVRSLETAAWITADMSFRRGALESAGGFNPAFPQAYREDSDIALRLLRGGWGLTRGRRRVAHPAGAAPRFASLRKQAGNADDATMRWLHGRGWRREVDAPAGALRWHFATTVAMCAMLLALASRRKRAALATGSTWLFHYSRFAFNRIRIGPWTPPEVAEMAATSVLIPPLAVHHSLRGHVRAAISELSGRNARWRHAARPPPPDAVLFDRDGTLIEDVPYNGDPDAVVPVAGAAEAIQRLREAGIAVGVVTNQSGVGRRLIEEDQLLAVNRRVEEILGPFGTWQICPHAPDAGCECRKPSPVLIARAARDLGVDADRCAVVGDIGSDIEAAGVAGATAILVPTAITRAEEIDAATNVAPDLGVAVEALLRGGHR